MRPVEQLHTGQIDLPELHDEGEPFLYRMFLPDGGEALIQPAVDLLFPEAQRLRLVGVGRHPLQAEEEGGAEGDGVGFPLPEFDHRPFFRAEGLDCRVQPEGVVPEGAVIEVYVCEGHKQPVFQKPGGFIRKNAGLPGGRCQPDQRTDQPVLEGGGVRLLAADPHFDAAAAAGGLLALETKHLGHGFTSCKKISRHAGSRFQYSRPPPV